jgi:hypothetical protein
MNNIRIIKQRVCLAIFFVGISLTGVEHFDNSFVNETTTETTVEIVFDEAIVKN